MLPSSLLDDSQFHLLAKKTPPRDGVSRWPWAQWGSKPRSLEGKARSRGAERDQGGAGKATWRCQSGTHGSRTPAPSASEGGQGWLGSLPRNVLGQPRAAPVMFDALSCLSGLSFALPHQSQSLGPFKKSVPGGLASAMAAQLVEDQVTCSICLDRYRDPVTLPCGHSFCGGCMQDSWRCWEKTCPECRQPFPEGTKLCRSVTLSTLLKTLPLELQAQEAAIPRSEPGAGHGARCPRHGRPLEFFCRTDGLCVCSACTVHECRHHERALLDVERRVREVRDGAQEVGHCSRPEQGLQQEAAGRFQYEPRVPMHLNVAPSPPHVL